MSKRKKIEGHWFVTTRTPKPTVRNGVSICKTYAYLRHSSDEKRVFMELTGPTGEESLKRYADQLNTAEKEPPAEQRKCAADGVRLPGK